jgi:hypothetical protein
MSRLRGGELLALGGAVVLLVALFLPWFDRLGSVSGWNGLGWLVLAFAAAGIAAAAWLAIANLTRRPVALVVGASVLSAVIGVVAFAVLVLRVLVFQPGDNAITTLRYGAWLGLAGAAAIVVGAWWALADERTGAPESAYEPPPARPAPPERAS